MTKAHSVYLDLFRLLAAFLVFLEHFSIERFTGGVISFFHSYGHDAVVIFFVLSGYVIAYVANTKEHTISDYIISRVSRLYSVIIPALLLTVLLDYSGNFLNPSIYEGKFASDYPVLRFVINLLNLQQVWFLGVKPFTNGPFWSMCYEFWYYIIFATAFYLRGQKRYILPIILLIAVGPKVAILFPIWMLGVGVYYLHKRNINLPFAPLIFFSSPILYLLVKNIFYPEIPIFTILGFSGEFLRDYITGFFVTAHLLASKDTFAEGRKISQIILQEKCVKVIRSMASVSFTMYLCHIPLLFFWATIIDNDPNSYIDIFIIFSAVMISIYVWGQITEKRKYIVKNLILKVSNKT